MKVILIILIWSAYCILHSYLISIRFTNRVKNVLKKYYAFYRLFYVIISTILLIPVFYYSSEFKSEVIIRYPLWIIYFRYFLIFGSLLLFFKAFFFDYDPLSFFGIRQIKNFNEMNSEKGKIQKKGLLKIVRHPMYFAVLILLWSSNIERLTDIAVNTVLTVYIIIGTRLEEKKLILEFGDDYIQYQREVPMLIPFTKFHNHINTPDKFTNRG